MGILKFTQWKDLQLATETLSLNSSPRDLLEILLSWLRTNHKLCFIKPFSDYRLDKFLKANESALPVDFSSVTNKDVMHFKSIIIKYSYKDVNKIAQFLRDVFEELVIFEIDEQCPVCKSWGMRVLVGEANGIFAHECKVCTYAKYLDGSDINGDNLVFASTSKLREAGFLK